MVLALVLASLLGQASAPIPIINGTTTTTSGTYTASGLSNGDVVLAYTVGTVTGGGSIAFSLCTVDPLNPSAGCILSAASPSVITATGPATLTLHAGRSMSVRVFWVVTASFSAPITLSLMGLPSVGTSYSSWISDYCCCGTTDTTCPSYPNGTSQITECNDGPSTIFLGPTGVTAFGVPLQPGQCATDTPTPLFVQHCISTVAQLDGGCLVRAETLP